MKKPLTFFLFFLFTYCVYSQPLEVVSLRCEHKINPLGIEQSFPELSWQLKSDQRSIIQTGYRILVSDDLQSLQKNVGNIWDSKKINGDPIQIIYKGKKLLPAKKYYWKVMVWDNKKNVSDWSEYSQWQMGLMNKINWNGARWIAYEKLHDSLKIIPGIEGKGNKNMPEVKDVLPLFRKDFGIRNNIKQATMFICGLGQFELSINGEKIGNHFLDPGWTEYDKQSLYVTFDVTKNLQRGTNAIGVMLGNGFYFMPRQRYRKLTVAFGFPKMICRLLIEYQDGSFQNVVSDQTWKTAASPITFSSIYGGEDYNANLEQRGWNTNSFDDKLWKQVVLTDGPSELNSQMAEPVKVFEHFSPNKISKVNDSVFVYDMGQNASAIPSITLRGKQGDTVKIIPGELLNPNGTVNQKATGRPYYFEYVIKGDTLEHWEPRFTYYGFRYLQVEVTVPKGKDNPAKLPEVIELESLHTRNSASKVGDFSCSSELFNKTYSLIDWAIKSNLQSVVTDCPHREKLGWLEQVHLMGNSIRYNYDVVNLFKKTVHDMMAAQTSDGLIPEIAPEFVKFGFGGGMFRDSPEWGSTGIILPWYLYEWFNEKNLLKEAYPMMQRYAHYLAGKAKNHILYQGLGDWYDLGPKAPGVSQLTPMGITATAIYYYDLTILGKIAQILNKPKDVKVYKELAGKVKNAFNKKFFNSATKEYGTGSQTANAMAVYMNLVMPSFREDVVNNIVKNIKANNNALTAGDIGYRYLLQVLEDEGRSQVIFEMNNRTDVPGYGYQISKGATSLTESWQALPTVSNNHLMLGHLMEWFYSGLCGIKQSKGSIAFKKIDIHPDPVGNITSAKASYESPYGLISSSWTNAKGLFKLNIDIPPNTTATIYLPAEASSSIKENGQLISANKDARYVEFQKGRAIFQVGSGHYQFVVNK